MTWLSGEAANGLDTAAVEELVGRTPWGTTLSMIVESDTLIGLLAELLSTCWLRERHLDLFGIYLTYCAGEGPNEWLIGGVFIAQLVKLITPGVPLQQHGTLADFGNQLIGGKYSKVLLPANINDNHWILIQIDIGRRTIVYGALFYSYGHYHIYSASGCCVLGDPLHRANDKGDVPALRAGLEIWLSSVFNAPFKWRGRRLQIRQQTDSYSCGIFVMNAMEHTMFNRPIFGPEEKHNIRIRYFTELVEYVLELVSRSCASGRWGWLMPSQSPEATMNTGFPSNVAEGAPTHRGGQSFQLMSFDGEHAVVNASWAAKRRCSHPPPQPLSDEATQSHGETSPAGRYYQTVQRTPSENNTGLVHTSQASG